MISEEAELIKIIIAGPEKSGKTSLFNKKVSESYTMSIGIDFLTLHQTVDGKPYKIQLWDFAGNEKFKSVIEPHYRLGLGVIFVYDASDKESFQKCSKLFNQVVEADLLRKNAKGILVATKLDLQQQVSTVEGLDLASQIGGYMQLSVLQNPDSIKQVCDSVIRRIKDPQSSSISELNIFSGLKISQKQEVKETKKEEENAGPAAPQLPIQKLQQEIKPRIAKVILIGDDRSGKTSLFLKFVQDKFDEIYIATIGVDFRVKAIESNGQTYKLQIWDTAGQERFKCITRSYYKVASIMLLVYDCQNVQSFEKVKQFAKEFEEFGNANCSKFLVANKSGENNEKITVEEGMNMAKEIGSQFMEVSAKTGFNIKELFQMSTDHAIKNGYI